jgi:F0F1-type ATP synthase assembly protein I
MRTPLEKNLQPIARTLSEAKRDAQYACAIQTFKSDTRLAIDFIENAVIGALWVGIIAGLIGSFVYWLFGG